VLLFKSRSSGGDARTKDNQDFARALGYLPAKAREWLKLALQKTKPEHAWLAEL
jgi:predicted RNA-binding Zn ribbon-like protein